MVVAGVNLRALANGGQHLSLRVLHECWMVFFFFFLNHGRSGVKTYIQRFSKRRPSFFLLHPKLETRIHSNFSAVAMTGGRVAVDNVRGGDPLLHNSAKEE